MCFTQERRGAVYKGRKSLYTQFKHIEFGMNVFI